MAARDRSPTKAPARPADPRTESPAFQAWFAGSQVVAKGGVPLVLYHGTDAAHGLRQL
jgi:hypothetical protein